MAHRGSGPGDGDLIGELCFYRRLYALRGTADRASTLSVTGAVAYGEMLMRVARRRDEAKSRRGARPAA
jgi:hypothetical protein